MALTSLSVKDYNYPELNSYDPLYKLDPNHYFHTSIECLRDATKEYSKDKIMLAHLYQKTPAYAYQYWKNQNDLDGLYKAVESYCNGGDAVQIVIYGKINNSDAGHALLALGIKENTSNRTIISVYDCNYPGKECYLYLSKSGNRYYDWKYELFPSTTWGKGIHSNSEISFSTPGYNYSKGYNDLMFTTSLVVADKNIDLHCSNQMIPVQEVNFVTDLNDSLIYEDNLKYYWIYGDEYILSSDSNVEGLIIASSNSRISVDMPKNGEISICNDNAEINTVEVALESKADTNISIEILDAKGSVVPVNVDANEINNLKASIDKSEIVVEADGKVDVLSETEILLASSNNNEILKIDLNNSSLQLDMNYEQGDITKDGAIGIPDVSKMENYFLGKDESVASISTSDVNEDNTLNILDVIMIKNKAKIPDSNSTEQYILSEGKIIANLSDNGHLDIIGTGGMPDFSLENRAPWFGKNINSVSFGTNITHIGNYSFEGNCNISCIDIADNVISIGDSAFENCKSLENVMISGELKTIGKAAFKNCIALSDINLSNSIEELGAEAFTGCANIKNIIIPEKITVIKHETFKDCSSLEDVYVLGKLKSIENNAFTNCINLITIPITEDTTSIGDEAFKGCTRLSNVILPTKINYIGTGAFSNCESIIYITIPENVSTIKENVFECYC